MKLTRILTTILSVTIILTLAIPFQHAKASTDSTFANGWDAFTSCDKDGNDKHIFLPSEDVYVKGGWFPLHKNKEVSIYVMPNGLKIKDINPAHAIAGPVSKTVNSEGHLPTTEIWTHNLKIGEYDVWIDVNQNGKFDDGDIFHYYFFFSLYLFHVIPETLIGTIGSLAAMASGFAIFYLRKPRKTHRKTTPTSERVSS